MKRNKSNYYIDLQSELGKVQWPDQKTTINTSLVVFFIVFFTSLIIFFYDLGFGKLIIKLGMG